MPSIAITRLNFIGKIRESDAVYKLYVMYNMKMEY